MKGPSVVVLCTAARGGMRSVVEGYREAGLFERYRVRWLATHEEGPLARRLGVAARAYLALWRMLLSGGVAAVHSHMAMRGSFWRKSVFNATARAFGVPVVAHLHGSEFKDFHAGLPRWGRALVAREFERCRVVIVLSEGWADFVRSIAPHARVMVLPNHVALPDRGADTAGDGDEVRLLFLGAVGERKGMYELLPAFSEALHRQPTLRLIIGGHGELDRARALARALGIAERVSFLGWIDGAAKAEALRQAHFYVLPSHNEGLPMSLLEAMAHGLPVISTRVGGIPELVRDGVDGLLVDAGDVHALAGAIIALAVDPARRRTLGASAYDRVAATYSEAAVLPRLQMLYDGLIGPGDRS